MSRNFQRIACGVCGIVDLVKRRYLRKSGWSQHTKNKQAFWAIKNRIHKSCFWQLLSDVQDRMWREMVDTEDEDKS